LDHEVNRQFVNVINAQAKLIDKLLHNQKHLLKSIRALSSNESSSLSTSAFTKEQPNWHHFSQKYLQNDLDESENKLLPIKKVKNINKNPERDLFESEMSEEELIEQSDQSEYKMIKIPETKNVIKNFSKSLFRFIQKQRVYVSRVLDHLNIKE
jgi:hypothetical protein